MGDITLDVNSPAIDTGDNTTFIQDDFSGSPRIGNVDIGAFEYGSTIPNRNLSIAITSPTANRVIGDSTGVRVKGTLIDINNEVDVIKYYLNDTKFIGQDLLPRKIEHVIGYQHLKTGINSFKMKAILKNGSSFYSAPLIIEKKVYPPTTSSKSQVKISTEIQYYYNSKNKDLIIHKPNDVSLKAIEVYNLLGKKVQVWKNLTNENQSIYRNISDLSSGIYIIRIETEKGNILSKKFVKD
jgi:hypothetical protein